MSTETRTQLKNSIDTQLPDGSAVKISAVRQEMKDIIDTAAPVQNLTDLRNYSGSAGHVVPVGGDRGGLFVAKDSDPFGNGDDGAVALQASDGTWWVRQEFEQEGIVRPQWFGITPGNSAPYDDKIDTLVNTTQPGQNIIFPPGTFKIAPEKLDLGEGRQGIIGTGRQSFSQEAGTTFIIEGNGAFGIRLGNDPNNSNRGNRLEGLFVKSGAGDVNVGVKILRCTRLRMEDVSARGFTTAFSFDNSFSIVGENLVAEESETGFEWVGESHTTATYTSLLALGCSLGFDLQSGANSVTFNGCPRTDLCDDAVRVEGFNKSLTMVSPEIERLGAQGTAFLLNGNSCNIIGVDFGIHDGEQIYFDFQSGRRYVITGPVLSGNTSPGPNGKVVNVGSNIGSKNILFIGPRFSDNAGDLNEIQQIAGNGGVAKISNDIVIQQNGKGITLTSPDGSQTKTFGCRNDGSFGPL